mgnify:CR=1 FL=1
MKEVVREAVRKEQIVPGKIRVISIFLALIVATVVTTAVVLGDVQRKDRAVQEHLAEEVLRFHVLANSDSRKDQAVKLEVRDAVLSYLKEVLPEGMDVKETTRWMREHTEEIRRVAQQKMTDLQMQQTVSVAVTTCYFPDRTYGDVTFPAGNYKTLRIELGEAAGESAKTVQRYIWISRLSDSLLDMVDAKKIGIMQAVDLSFLSEDAQQWVLVAIQETNVVITTQQSAMLKESDKKGELTFPMVRMMLEKEKTVERKVVIKTERINNYFPATYSREQIENIIYQLLENWKSTQ